MEGGAPQPNPMSQEVPVRKLDMEILLLPAKVPRPARRQRGNMPVQVQLEIQMIHMVQPQALRVAVPGDMMIRTLGAILEEHLEQLKKVRMQVKEPE